VDLSVESVKGKGASGKKTKLNAHLKRPAVSTGNRERAEARKKRVDIQKPAGEGKMF